MTDENVNSQAATTEQQQPADASASATTQGTSDRIAASLYGGDVRRGDVVVDGFTVPEGTTVDRPLAQELRALAEEWNLPEGSLDRLAGLGMKHAGIFQQRQAEAMTHVRSQWAQQAQLDIEIGGEKLDDCVTGAKAALERLGTTELRTMLNVTGLGNHPEFIRMFYRVSQALDLPADAGRGESGGHTSRGRSR
ncbi:hypothetical protein R20233_02364 [Ralstonia sp. LMG 32965]|uniref:hypothetical protein n=1 Tax=Ralstonia flatus TaxID=3058601 RepID=UPI0028F533F4|nr:hypothetical protein [Ralstonia sp. LMG 32965]CAJ0877851.1 hypothetical protein R20233_02364 [Ralstonia sp. LMG 32965]